MSGAGVPRALPDEGSSILEQARAEGFDLALPGASVQVGGAGGPGIDSADAMEGRARRTLAKAKYERLIRQNVTFSDGYEAMLGEVIRELKDDIELDTPPGRNFSTAEERAEHWKSVCQFAFQNGKDLFGVLRAERERAGTTDFAFRPKHVRCRDMAAGLATWLQFRWPGVLKAKVITEPSITGAIRMLLAYLEAMHIVLSGGRHAKAAYERFMKEAYVGG